MPVIDKPVTMEDVFKAIANGEKISLPKGACCMGYKYPDACPHAGVYDEHSEACWECILDCRTSLEAFDQIRPNASNRSKAIKGTTAFNQFDLAVYGEITIPVKTIRDAKQSEAYKERLKDAASVLVSDTIQDCGLINTRIVKVKPETPMGGSGKTDDKVYKE